jgi:hypothetical protein
MTMRSRSANKAYSVDQVGVGHPGIGLAHHSVHVALTVCGPFERAGQRCRRDLAQRAARLLAPGR